MKIKLGMWTSICLLTVSLACSFPIFNENISPEANQPASTSPAPEGDTPTPISSLQPAALDKWSLWTHGTQLRGANVWSRVVVPELDGEEFLGDGYIGPPYTQQDFNDLAAMGANYVNISHPGLFTETPPYVLDEGAQEHLDSLLQMAAHAHLYAVITFRTGPGRSDFTFYRDGAGDWFDPELLREWVWTDAEAQVAWEEMWRYTANRYHENPIVVGYDLMCEPNSSGVFFEMYEPDEFLQEYAGSTYDWNQFYPRLVEAIRQEDGETPILIAAQGWSALRWLPALELVDAERIVYTFHQYEPQEMYTHQEPGGENSYPGQFDLDYDGEAETFDRAWLEEFLSIVADFQAETGAPVAVNEFGVERWEPNAAEFMQDEMEIFEELGINHALWAWSPAWQPYATVNGFNFLLGAESSNIVPIPNDLQNVIVENWQQNIARP